jgi:hypothetical protein
MNELKDNLEGFFRSWVIFAPSDEITKIQKETDKIFSGYSFYPEVDWKIYGHFPPDGHQVMGAWRHPQTNVFAFLLDNPQIKTFGSNAQLLLYVAGEATEISNLGSKIDVLKTKASMEELKDKIHSQDEERLGKISKKPLVILTAVLSIFAAIINGFSLYLRKIPPPEFGSQELIRIYQYLVASVHFCALILLLIVIAICVGFLLKYGTLLIRRL